MPKWQNNYLDLTVWLNFFNIAAVTFGGPLVLFALYFILFLSGLIQVSYAVYYFIPFIFYKPPVATGFSPSVSVIIAAHNELNNLQRLLPLVLEQDYPQFEVIVVNDRSTDGTEAYLAQLAKEQDCLRFINIREEVKNSTSKKHALTRGVAAATHDYLLLTDADCIPLSNKWIAGMLAGFAKGCSLVAGYSPYIKKPGFLNHLICFETLLTAIQYLSYSVKGNAYMAVGRNFAYTKACFYKINGFSSHKATLGGDDDLFVQDALKHYKLNIAITKESQAASIPKNTYREWIIQKRRHLHVGRKYKLPDKLRLGFFMGSNIFFYLIFLFLLFAPGNLILLGIIFTLRSVVVYVVYKLIAQKLKEPLSVFLLPVLDLVYFLQYLVLGASVLIFKKIRWK